MTRPPDKPSPALPTPRTTLAANALLAAICRRCNRSAHVDLAALVAGRFADTPLRELPLRCSACGSAEISILVEGRAYR